MSPQEAVTSSPERGDQPLENGGQPPERDDPSLEVGRRSQELPFDIMATFGSRGFMRDCKIGAAGELYVSQHRPYRVVRAEHMTNSRSSKHCPNLDSWHSRPTTGRARSCT